MPFVQISMLQGKTSARAAAVSDAVHQALVNVFDISIHDKFHVVQELTPSQLLYPLSYMGIPHTRDIVYIHITCKEGRTTDMKRLLYANIASDVAQRTGMSQDDVVIVLSENKAENWSFGQGRAQLVDGE
jgi:phenylpyruvate tautomerase PptA (4-oxalocrotonate tautomerase family)